MVASHAVDPPAPRPGEAESLSDLSATLVALRAWAGSPSFTEIARRIRQLRATRPGAGIDQPPGRVTVYDCFREGRRRLDIDLVSDIVTVLGAPDDVPHWQRAHARIEAEAQSSSVARVLDELPAPGIRLVGREAELHRLVRSDRPVTAVVGMPGVGKTELALHTAAALADDHDLHLFANLHGYGDDLPPADPGAVLGGLLRHLGVRPASIWRLDLQGRVDRVREALSGRRPLTVLDNVRGDLHTEPLLAALAGTRVILTSRTSAGVPPDADRLTLEELPAEAATELLRGFVPHLDLSPADPATRRLLDLCGGLPLQVALIGARMAEHPAWTLSDQLHRLESLPDGHSIRPALESSYRSLDPAVAATLRALALHPGDGVAAESLAAMRDLPTPEIEGHGRRLVTEHLATSDPEGRLHLHALVRSYASAIAWDLDSHSDRAAGLARLLRHHVDVLGGGIGSAHSLLDPGPANARSRAWLSREWPAIHAACLLVRDHPDLDAELGDLLELLMPWLEAESRLLEAIELCRLAEGISDGDRQALAAIHLSVLHDLMSEGDVALDWAERAVELAHSLTWTAQGQVGQVLVRIGRLEEGRRVLAEAAEHIEEIHGSLRRGRVLAHLAAVLLVQDSIDEGKAIAERALALAEDNADLETVCRLHATLAVHALSEEDTRQAIRRTEICLDIEERLQLRFPRPRFYLVLAHAASLEGRHDDALALAETVLVEAAALESPFAVCEGHLVRALIRNRAGLYAEAEADYREALAQAEAIDTPWIRANALSGLGDVAVAGGDYTAAAEHYSEAIAVAREMGNEIMIARTQVGLGDLAYLADDPATARSRWTEALPHYDRLGSPEAARIADRLQQLHRAATVANGAWTV